MKKLLSASALFILLMSCTNSSDSTTVTDSTSANPSAIDTTQQPNGSVMSTDTTSMNVDNTGNVDGGDSSNPK